MEEVRGYWNANQFIGAQSIDEARLLFNHDLADHSAAQNNIHLVLADYRLGAETTGTQAIAAVWQWCDKKIPAIIISGDTAPERIREMQASGHRLLRKPVAPDDLRRAVEEALQ